MFSSNVIMELQCVKRTTDICILIDDCFIARFLRIHSLFLLNPQLTKPFCPFDFFSIFYYSLLKTPALLTQWGIQYCKYF